jgi:ferredoxin
MCRPQAEKLDLCLRPYAVIATCEDGGILETITDAVAIDTLKKKMSSGTDVCGGGDCIRCAECVLFCSRCHFPVDITVSVIPPLSLSRSVSSLSLPLARTLPPFLG